MQDRLDEALRPYETALEIRKARFGESSTQVVISLNNLGTLSEARGDLDSALLYLRRAADILHSLPSDRRHLLAILLNNIGRVLTKLGRTEEACTAHKEALEVHRLLFGPNHKHTAMTLIFLAEALEATDPEESERNRDAGLEMLERTYGSEHPKYTAAASRRSATVE
jgi:tetratricopeptide (TPR) repeat protein